MFETVRIGKIVKKRNEKHREGRDCGGAELSSISGNVKDVI